MTTKLIFKKSNFTANAITNVTYYTYTITPVPADAIVVLTASGSTQSGNKIVVEANTTVNWTVSKQGYITQTGSKVITADLTDTVTLSEDAGELVLTSSMMSAGQANGDGSIKQTAGFARRIATTEQLEVSQYNQVYVPAELKYSIVWFNANGNGTNISTGTPTFWTNGTDSWINIQDITANLWQYNGNSSAVKFRISFGLVSNADLDPAGIDQYEVKLRHSTIQKTPLLLTPSIMQQGLLTGQGNIIGKTEQEPGGQFPNRISSNIKFNLSDYTRILIPEGFKWTVDWFTLDDTPIVNKAETPTSWTQTTGVLSLNSVESFPYDTHASKFMISIGAADNHTLDYTQVESYGIYLYPASYTD